jgi:N-acyl-D-amino-acid deacylase
MTTTMRKTMTTTIFNCTVHDGTGALPFTADIGLDGDRIVDIGDLRRAEADSTIDAAGAIVCPGFIDVHTHSDAYILLEPAAPSKLYQGVTTEIAGNCGASCAPLYGDARMPSDWTVHTYPGPWRTVAEYRALVEQIVPGPNMALLVGHNTLRAGVTGYADRPASAEEIRLMVCRLEQALDEGACGLSTGLVYTPGRYAETGEITVLAAATAARGGIYTSHMRSETSRLIEALDETLDIGRHTGIRVQVSHLKAAGRKNWPLLETAIERIRSAQAEGLDVAADRYPYTSSCTDLDIIFPGWASAGGLQAVLARLRDPAERSRLREELIRDHDDAYWETITVGSTAHRGNLQYQGQPLTAVAATMKVHPADAALTLADTDELRTAAFFHGMSEDGMLRVLEQPWVMIGSDASLRATTGPLSHDWPHPRAYGSFPRFLRMALDGKTVPLPEAIRKMTSLPARTFRLADRGEIRKGFAADLLVIDPLTLCERTSYARPHVLAEGIRHVFVNGVHTLRDGTITGHRGGRFL